MLYCPSCNKLYGEAVETCLECGVKTEEIEIVSIGSVESRLEEEIIQEKLREAGVIGISKAEDIGDYLQIAQGNTLGRYRILVPSYDEEKAKKVFNEWRLGNSTSSGEGYPRKRKINQLLAILALIIIAVVLVLAYGSQFYFG